MRRADGTGLVRNEMRILAASMRILLEGTAELYGYELFARLSEWEGQPPMNHGTLYRGMRALERRGLFDTTISEVSGGPPRVVYRLTSEGTQVARAATNTLADDVMAPTWLSRRYLQQLRRSQL